MPTDQDKVIRKLRAILSADVKGYSLLMTDDETFTIQTLKAHRTIMTNCIEQHNGRVVDSPGDNVLAEFASAVDAVQCAVEIQRQLKIENDHFVEGKRLQFRIGVNIGDVVQDGDRIYGSGVNVAARIEALAEPGGVCISRNAYDHIKDKLKLGYEYLGQHEVKNIKDPVRVYKVLMDPGDAGKLIGDVPKPVAKNWIWATAVVSAVVITAVLSFVYQRMTEPEFEPASVEKMAYPLPDKPSIAVLPFDNMSGNPEQEYFSDGITEDIITTLSKIDDLFVIARNSTFTYKGKPVKIKQVAEELGVRYVLEGSVRKSEDRVRITAQLIDAVEGNHLWAERYDRDLKDIFALQDEITMKIVTALRIELTEGEQARMWGERYENLNVQLKVMEGLSLWRKGTKEGLIRYGQIGKEIVDMAPESPAGYITLAVYNWTLAIHGESPQESIAKAFKHAQKALALNESFATTHAILGNVYLLMRKYEKAIAAVERAVELEPNGADVHVLLGSTLGYAGRLDEAIGHLNQGIRLNPFPPSWYFMHLGRCYRQKGQYAEALTAFEKALQRSPEDIHNHMSLAAVYALLDRQDEAAAAAQKVLEIDPHFTIEHASKAWPYKNPADLKIIVDALRKAGLPYEPPLSLPEKPSIAVLPFDNMSDDPEQEYFSDGMTDELIGDLAKIKDIFVISRNSAFTYKGKAMKVQQIAEELNVRYILEGSVQRSGNKVRIRAQLIDGKTDHHLWSESYDGVMDDIFELQDKITGKIVSALALKLSPSEADKIASKGTDSVIAHDLYLKGNAYLRRWSPDALVIAIKYFKQAVEMDSTYSQAYVGLAHAYRKNVLGGKPFQNKTGQDFGGSHYLMRHYLELAMKNPTPEAYSLLALFEVRRRNYTEALNLAEKAVELAPNSSDALINLGIILTYIDRPNEAIQYIKQAIRLNPLEGNFELGFAYMAMGYYEKAIESVQRSLTDNPQFLQPHMVSAISYVHLGYEDKAKEEFNKYLKLWSEGFYPDMQFIYFMYCFKNPDVFNRFIEGLVKAGYKKDSRGYYPVDEANKLNGHEIQKLLFGKTINLSISGMDYVIVRSKEGVLKLSIPSYMVSFKGKSWIKGDMVCNQYENLWEGVQSCNDIYYNPEGNAIENSQYLSLSDALLIPFSIED